MDLFDTLPYEILWKILKLVMASDVAVELDIVSLKRDCMEFSTELYGYSGSETCRNEALVERHKKCRHEPYKDWAMVTGTCHLFRRTGKEAFFSTKNFIIYPRTLVTMIRGTVEKMTPADQALAINTIRHVIVPLGHSSSHVLIPRFASLPRLQSLHLLFRIGALVCREAVTLLNPNCVWRPCPDEFARLLKALGLRLDKRQIRYNSENFDYLSSYMQTQSYPTLKALITQKEKKVVELLGVSNTYELPA